jgi:hypothetical protein
MMKDNLWHFDAAPLRFDEAGDIIDGQHRLWAVINSETSQEFMFVYGISRAAQIVMDMGKSRNLGDFLSMRKEVNVSRLQALITASYKWHILEKRGREIFRSNYPIAIEELLEYFDSDADTLRDSARAEHRLRSAGIRVSPRAMTLAWHLFQKIDYEDTSHFFDSLKTMIGQEEGSPIIALRKKFDIIATTGTSENGQSATETLAYTIKAWNAYRAGAKIQILAWRAGGANPEKFPEPK